MVFAGNFLPAQSVTLFSAQIGVGVVQWLIFAQVFVGGVLILFMDEVISKWGVGSGIGLFIIAGVSQRLIGGLFTFRPSAARNRAFSPRGSGLSSATSPPVRSWLPTGSSSFSATRAGMILPLITTVLIFVVVVYAESVRVEIPLSNARVKGARGRFPVKLIYASVLPMILVRALQANVQFLGRILYSQLGGLPPWLGTYATQEVTRPSRRAGCSTIWRRYSRRTSGCGGPVRARRSGRSWSASASTSPSW